MATRKTGVSKPVAIRASTAEATRAGQEEATPERATAKHDEILLLKDEVNSYVFLLGLALKEMKEGKLYRQMEPAYASFKEYCQRGAGISHKQATKYLRVASSFSDQDAQEHGIEKLDLLASWCIANNKPVPKNVGAFAVQMPSGESRRFRELTIAETEAAFRGQRPSSRQDTSPEARDFEKQIRERVRGVARNLTVSVQATGTDSHVLLKIPTSGFSEALMLQLAARLKGLPAFEEQGEPEEPREPEQFAGPAQARRVETEEPDLVDSVGGSARAELAAPKPEEAPAPPLPPAGTLPVASGLPLPGLPGVLWPLTILLKGLPPVRLDRWRRLGLASGQSGPPAAPAHAADAPGAGSKGEVDFTFSPGTRPR